MAGGQRVRDPDFRPPSKYAGFQPANRGEALKHLSLLIWKGTENTEVEGLLKRGTFLKTTRQSLPPDADINSTMFTYTDKVDLAKARLVYRGDRQLFPPSKRATFTSTQHLTSVVFCSLEQLS